MRYFEQARADDSGRFWAVRVEQNALVVHEGDFGSPGTERVEEFATLEDAQRTAVQRIAAQIRSGYREVVKAQNPRDLQPQAKRPEYRNGLEELILLEERMVDLIRAQQASPSRSGIDSLLDRYTDVVAADAQLLKGYLKRERTTVAAENDPDPELWREVKDEMHSLVPLVITLKDGDPATKPVSDALAKLEKVFLDRSLRTRARMVPKMYLALGEADLMNLGRALRQRCRTVTGNTPARGVVAAKLRA